MSLSFDDNDLKILKNWVEAIKGDLVFDALPSGKLVALIKRMEAAERYAWAHDPLNGIVDLNFALKAKEAWRKAAGR